MEMDESGDVLAQLQAWYLNQTSGDWEHQYGISCRRRHLPDRRDAAYASRHGTDRRKF